MVLNCEFNWSDLEIAPVFAWEELVMVGIGTVSDCNTIIPFLKNQKWEKQQRSNKESKGFRRKFHRIKERKNLWFISKIRNQNEAIKKNSCLQNKFYSNEKVKKN
jgi:hypothetical protein